MSETPPAPPHCAGLREDLALHAAGKLDEAEARGLEAHLRACSACRALLESERAAWEEVRRGSAPSEPLDSEKVLRELRRRIAVESRESLAPAAHSRRRTLLGLFLAAGFVLLALALALRFGPGSPDDERRRPPPGSETPPLAHALPAPGASGKAEPLAAGVLAQAGPAGLVIRFAAGAELRLREGARVRVRDAREAEVEEGEVAVQVPAGRQGFRLHGRQGLVTAPDAPTARFTLDVNTGDGDVHLAVAEGRVKFQGASGRALEVSTGEASSLDVAQEPEPPRKIDPGESFAWVVEHLARSLACELRVESAGRKQNATLVLRNQGALPVDVAAFHALGVNYQLELRRPGAPTSEFLKLAPSALRKRAGTASEPLRESPGDVRLDPGESYEIDLDLSAQLAQAGPYVLAAHYLGLLRSGTETGTGWGFTLRSPEVKMDVGAPPKEPAEKK